MTETDRVEGILQRMELHEYKLQELTKRIVALEKIAALAEEDLRDIILYGMRAGGQA